MAKLLGYKRFTSKKGTPCCMATIIKDLTGRQREYGSVGQTSEDIFMPKEQLDMLTPSDIGKEIELKYDFEGGRAYLVNVIIKNGK